MNDDRRKLIAKAVSLLTEAQTMVEQAASEEREYFDNMPEGLQSGDKGTRAEEIADTLEEASNALHEMIGELETTED